MLYSLAWIALPLASAAPAPEDAQLLPADLQQPVPSPLPSPALLSRLSNSRPFPSDIAYEDEWSLGFDCASSVATSDASMTGKTTCREYCEAHARENSYQIGFCCGFDIVRWGEGVAVCSVSADGSMDKDVWGGNTPQHKAITGFFDLNPPSPPAPMTVDDARGQHWATHPTCVKVKTTRSGYVAVKMFYSGGSETEELTLQKYDKGTMVVNNTCYSGLTKIEVTSSNANEWWGGVVQYDDADTHKTKTRRTGFKSMTCTDSCNGGRSDDVVVFGGNFTTGVGLHRDQFDTYCINGNTCTFEVP